MIYIVLIICVLAISACKKPYDPPIVTANNNFLVVEGLINSGQDSTFIKLSRTVKLSSTAAPKPELEAVVSVESDQNIVYPLQEAGGGLYSSAALNLSSTSKYRLRIKTSDNREYLSDLVEAKETPDIDSISYTVQNNGIQFYANAHDPKNNTRYYRWDFDESWKYVSFYQSFWKILDGYPAYRLQYNGPDDVYDCYYTDQSHQILLGSSAKLGQDVIAAAPINFVEANSGKISFVYSVMLRQYALTPDAFAYWQNLKKNTEQLGSIFDAQPSSLRCNIHCISNPAEAVLGYISASSVKAKRILIDHNKIDLYTPYYVGPPDAGACLIHNIYIAPEASFQDRLG